MHRTNCREEEELETKISYLRCFKRFAEYLKEFDNLKIQFGEYEHQFLVSPKFGDYPRIMDPVNPYNNLAKSWSSSYTKLEQLKLYANVLYDRLDKWENSGSADVKILFPGQFPIKK